MKEEPFFFFFGWVLDLYWSCEGTPTGQTAMEWWQILLQRSSIKLKAAAGNEPKCSVHSQSCSKALSWQNNKDKYTWVSFQSVSLRDLCQVMQMQPQKQPQGKNDLPRRKGPLFFHIYTFILPSGHGSWQVNDKLSAVAKWFWFYDFSEVQSLTLTINQVGTSRKVHAEVLKGYRSSSVH